CYNLVALEIDYSTEPTYDTDPLAHRTVFAPHLRSFSLLYADGCNDIHDIIPSLTLPVLESLTITDGKSSRRDDQSLCDDFCSLLSRSACTITTMHLKLLSPSFILKILQFLPSLTELSISQTGQDAATSCNDILDYILIPSDDPQPPNLPYLTDI